MDDESEQVNIFASEMKALAPFIVFPGRTYVLRYVWCDDQSEDGEMSVAEHEIPLVDFGVMREKMMG